MKRQIVFTFAFELLLVCAHVYAQQTWVSQNSGIDENIQGVCFVDAKVGVAVSQSFAQFADGSILRTIDAGKTWAKIPRESIVRRFNTQYGDSFNKVFFPSPDTGFVVCMYGKIYRTINGGLTWVQQNSNVSDHLTDVFFTDPDTGIVVGGTGSILRTTDGGQTWTRQFNLTPAYDFRGVYFTDPDTGTVVGTFSLAGTLLRTIDGGKTWTQQNTESALQSVFFINVDTGWVVGSRTILRTTDGGQSWNSQIDGISPQPGSNQFGFFDVFFSDANRGTIVGGGSIAANIRILNTVDGGQTWTRPTIRTPSNLAYGLLGLHFSAPNTGTAVGTGGIILRTCPSDPSLDPDSDGDGLKDVVELQVTKTDICNPDTDGDGLLDSWEVDPNGVPGAGFDVNLDGIPDVTRDEVFSPYFNQTTGRVNPTDFSLTGQYSMADKPNPLHKDLYLELDWLDCKRGGCFQALLPGDIDPNHHAPDLDALRNVIAVFEQAPVRNPDGRTGIRLHILIDEGLKHTPNCDKDESFTRLTQFGTVSQRMSTDIMKAKERAFRYVWAGHSTRFDYSSTSCPTPSFYEATLQGLGCLPLPDYDYSPFGSAKVGGRDILISPSPLWVCSETSVPFYGLLPTICFRVGPKCAAAPGNRMLPALPGIFPADVRLPNGQIKTVKWSMNMLLGISPQEGVRQFWSRAFMHLLGHSLGIPDEAVVLNDPNLPGSRPPDSYTNWENLQYAPGTGSPAPVESFPDLGLTAGGSLINVESIRDLDGDGISDDVDNCPWVANPDQSDLDGDGFGDICDGDIDGDQIANGTDNFPLDVNNDGVNDDMDDDDDGDGVLDNIDNCVIVANPDQTDTDKDGVGDVCDSDDDNDGIPDAVESTAGSDPLNPSSQPEFVGRSNTCTDRRDNDLDGRIDSADEGCGDADRDRVPDFIDSCPTIPNEIYQDQDGDGRGDDCDPDDDNDNVSDAIDLCPNTVSGTVVDSLGCSQSQVDNDGDSFCNPFSPGVGPSNCKGVDNCPTLPNPGQEDRDHDGIGDVCENLVAVNLSSFVSRVERNEVTLFWITAPGPRRTGFEIQHSLDNSNFVKIGFVTEPASPMNPPDYTFIDHVASFGAHYYRLKMIDVDGSFEFSGVVQAVVTPPDKYDLSQNYPNPFNPETSIRYAVPTKIGNKIHVTLRVYNLLGQVVRRLVDDEKFPGYYQIIWDGKDDHGTRVSSGIYLYLMTAGDFKGSKSMLILK